MRQAEGQQYKNMQKTLKEESSLMIMQPVFIELLMMALSTSSSIQKTRDSLHRLNLTLLRHCLPWAATVEQWPQPSLKRCQQQCESRMSMLAYNEGRFLLVTEATDLGFEKSVNSRQQDRDVVRIAARKLSQC